MDGLPPSGACRMCVVEVEGQRGLVPSCAFPVADGHEGPDALAAGRRTPARTIVELLLANHPDDCLYCARNGDCELQDLAAELGVRQRRFVGRKNAGDAGRLEPVDRPRPGEVHPLRQVRAGVRGDAGVGGDRLHRPRHRDRASARRSTRASTSRAASTAASASWSARPARWPSSSQLPRSAGGPRRPRARSSSCSTRRRSRSPWARSSASSPAPTSTGAMTAALRRLGFDRVFDTAFSADLTIMEEASELVHRIADGGTLPMMTSCSPGWIKFVEQFYPDLIPQPLHLQEPAADAGRRDQELLRREREGIDPERIFSVAIMPCTAKKFEAGRPEMGRDGVARHRRRADHARAGPAHPHARPRSSTARAGGRRHALRRAHARPASSSARPAA